MAPLSAGSSSQETSQGIETLLDTLLGADEHLDFFGEIPCPVKTAFHGVFDSFAQSHGIKSYIPTTCGLENTTTGREMLTLFSEGAACELPDAMASFGLRDLLAGRLIKELLVPEFYQAPPVDNLAEPFRGLGLEDPLGVFSVYATLPMVIVVDRRHVGDLPTPHRWEDLLDPVYRGAISLPGSHGETEYLPLLHFQQMFGDRGLRELAKNTKQLEIGSRAAIAAGSRAKNTAPLYLVTWFFANAMHRPDDVEIIIPEEGAFLNPLYVTARRLPSEKAALASSFIVGNECSDVFEKGFYPTTNGSIERAIPKDMRFQWIGWDAIRNNDITEACDELTERFGRYLNRR